MCRRPLDAGLGLRGRSLSPRLRLRFRSLLIERKSVHLALLRLLRRSSRSWLGLDHVIQRRCFMGLRGSVVLAKRMSRLGRNRRWRKFHAVRLTTVSCVCGPIHGRLGFPLLPLVAEAIDILPLLSEPLPFGLVDGLESRRTAATLRRLVKRRPHDVEHCRSHAATTDHSPGPSRPAVAARPRDRGGFENRLRRGAPIGRPGDVANAREHKSDRSRNARC